MHIMRSFFRKPVNSLLGTILVMLGVIVICVSVGQARASVTTSTLLESSFDTVAVMSGESLINPEVVASSHYYSFLNTEIGENTATWVVEAAETHPDIIKSISQNGLASSCLQDITPISYYSDGYTWDHINNHTYGRLSDVITDIAATPQSHAMLEITLEKISAPQPWVSSYLTYDRILPQNSFQDLWEWLEYERSLDIQVTPIECVTVELSGTITRVLSLEEGFKDPTGMTLRFTLSAKTYDELETYLSTLEVGKPCLVYGLDYYDMDWELRQELDIDEWDASGPRLATAEEKELWSQNLGQQVYAIYKWHGLDEFKYKKFNSVSLTGNLTGYNRLRHEPIRDESGHLIEIQEVKEATLTDPDGKNVTVTTEEYGEYYTIPSIVPLAGTVEEFLASEEGAPWQAALDRDGINSHAFPVIGVDDLGYVAQFAFGSARIVVGREFTEDELTSGATVCVISQELAAANGLQVGDTIHPNFYNADENLPYGATLSENAGLINPTAGLYFSTTPLLGETEYTVVGIYRCDEPWAVVTDMENHFAFTPNTIFAPKASIPSKMQYSQLLQFQTVVLHNGKLEDFAALLDQEGFADCFLLEDQGYSVIAKNFSDYQELSRRVFLLCTMAYGVVAMLYLLLFPGSQRRTMVLMESLGVRPRQRRRFIFWSSMLQLVPATLLGMGAGYLMWDKIIEKMRRSANILVEIQRDEGVMAAAALGQLILMAALSALVAAFQAMPRKLGKRR